MKQAGAYFWCCLLQLEEFRKAKQQKAAGKASATQQLPGEVLLRHALLSTGSPLPASNQTRGMSHAQQVAWKRSQSCRRMPLRPLPGRQSQPCPSWCRRPAPAMQAM